MAEVRKVNYVLAVPTHGDAPHLDRTVRSFFYHATVPPRYLVASVDKGVAPTPEVGTWHVHDHPRTLGFCENTRYLWNTVREYSDRCQFVFWLENDFEVRKTVDIAAMADALDSHPWLVQMALVRQPVNKIEMEKGSVVRTIPVYYRHPRWLEHRHFWTTNPSLIPMSTVLEWNWPDGPECEGKLGLAMRHAGAAFGYWGDGGTWVEHLGERTGVGY